ncbi:hypothetical protein Tco_0097128, partial [Tanacetum coccineum]
MVKLSVDLNEPKDSSKTNKVAQNVVPVSSVNVVDIDEFCLYDLKDMAVKLDYGVEDLMYCHFLILSLGLDYGLHSLNVDADVLEMLICAKTHIICTRYCSNMRLLDRGFWKADVSSFDLWIQLLLLVYE